MRGRDVDGGHRSGSFVSKRRGLPESIQALKIRESAFSRGKVSQPLLHFRDEYHDSSAGRDHQPYRHGLDRLSGDDDETRPRGSRFVSSSFQFEANPHSSSVDLSTRPVKAIGKKTASLSTLARRITRGSLMFLFPKNRGLHPSSGTPLVSSAGIRRHTKQTYMLTEKPIAKQEVETISMDAVLLRQGLFQMSAWV